MSLYDLVDHITTMTTIPFTVTGFGIAIWQTIKTRKAAEAAQSAVDATQRKLSRTSLLVLIPQLQRAEGELERAINQGSKDLVINWLAEWRWQASQLRGHLKIASPSDRRLLKLIQDSVVSAATTKTGLVGITIGDLSMESQKALAAIANVTNELGSLMAQQGIESGGSDNNG